MLLQLQPLLHRQRRLLQQRRRQRRRQRLQMHLQQRRLMQLQLLSRRQWTHDRPLLGTAPCFVRRQALAGGTC